MSSSSGSTEGEGSGKTEKVEVILAAQGENVSSEDPSMSQWSSLESILHHVNPKKLLQSKGLYSPGSGNLCAHYMAISDSSIFKHSYYKYPAVTDPGIKEALLHPDKPVIYPDDGKDLYLALCEEMNKCPVRMFHRGLTSDEINLRYYCVDPFGVRAMAMALQYNKYVQRLDLTDNFLNDDACYHLGRMLISNVTLRELILSGCRIGASGLTCLLENIKTNRHLNVLDISRNELGEDGGVNFAHKIETGMSIPIVNLSKNQLGKLTAVELAEGLEFRNTMTRIDLSLNNFSTPVATSKMLNMIAQNDVLEELNLSWSAMEGAKIASAILNIMFFCPSLAVLNLSNNRFYGDAISIIASGLPKAKKLVTFDLSRNPLSTADMLVLIDKMKKRAVHLQNLLLENIDVSPEFVESLKKVKNMKSRNNFLVTYGHVTKNWKIIGPDPRTVILQRVAYLGTCSKKHKVDVPLFFLHLNKRLSGRPIDMKELLNVVSAEKMPLGEDLLTELCDIFTVPGAKAKAKAKIKTLNLVSLCDYIKRMWPEKELPLSPVSEEEPETPVPKEEPETPLPPPPPPPPPSAATPPPAKDKAKGKK